VRKTLTINTYGAVMRRLKRSPIMKLLALSILREIELYNKNKEGIYFNQFCVFDYRTDSFSLILGDNVGETHYDSDGDETEVSDDGMEKEIERVAETLNVESKIL